MSGNTASSNRRECLTSSTQQLHKLIAVLLPRGKEGEKAVTEVQSLSAFFFFSNSLQNIKVSLLFCTLALPLLARTPSCRESTSVSVFRGFLWFTAAAFVFRGGWVAFGFVFLCFPPLYIYIYIFPFHTVFYILRISRAQLQMPAAAFSAQCLQQQLSQTKSSPGSQIKKKMLRDTETISLTHKDCNCHSLSVVFCGKLTCWERWGKSY